MGKKSGSGSGIRVRGEQPGSYFPVLKKKLSRIPDPGKTSRIREKHPGSATLVRTGGTQEHRENGGQDRGGNSEEQSGWVRGQEGENPEEQGLDGGWMQ